VVIWFTNQEEITMPHASARLIAKAPASTKARVVTNPQRGVDGKVAPAKVIPATKGKKSASKPLVGGPAGRHREKADKRG
jgi:hypothetical protein